MKWFILSLASHQHRVDDLHLKHLSGIHRLIRIHLSNLTSVFFFSSCRSQPQQHAANTHTHIHTHKRERERKREGKRSGGRTSEWKPIPRNWWSRGSRVDATRTDSSCSRRAHHCVSARRMFRLSVVERDGFDFVREECTPRSL